MARLSDRTTYPFPEDDKTPVVLARPEPFPAHDGFPVKQTAKDAEQDIGFEPEHRNLARLSVHELLVREFFHLHCLEICLSPCITSL